MSDQQIQVGAPSAPLAITLGSTAGVLFLHDNQDGTYDVRHQAAGGLSF